MLASHPIFSFFFLFFSSCCLLGRCHAQQELAPVPLWPGVAPGDVPGAVGPEAHVTTRASALYNITRYYNVTVPTFTPFVVPAAQCPSSGCPAVVIAPGGAYEILAFNLEGTDVAARFNAMGVSAFVLKYRVPQRPQTAEHPLFGWAPLQDAQRALRLVRAHAAEYHVDPQRLGFLGFSAGGHLTAQVVVNFGNQTYPPVDAADTQSARPDFGVLVYPWRLLRDNDPKAFELTPEVANLTAAMPPVMIAQNEDDPAAHVENSLVFFYKLKQVMHVAAGNKVPASTLHIYPRGGHGFGLCQAGTEAPAAGQPLGGYNECCDWPMDAQRFLQLSGLAPHIPTHPCASVYAPDGSMPCAPLSSPPPQQQ